MNSFLVATIQNSEKQTVGQVVADPNLTTHELDFKVHINGKKGQEIVEVLNGVSLVNAPIFPGDIWVLSITNKDRYIIFDFDRLVKAISSGELTLVYEPSAIGADDGQNPHFGLMHETEYDLRMLKDDPELTECVPLDIDTLQAIIDRLPPPILSPIQAVIHEYEAEPQKQGVDWLQRFKEALAQGF